MALKYYTASNAIRTTVPKKAYENDYEAVCESIFENTSNVFYDEIQYEATYGQKDFKTIPMVRVDSVVNYNTGIQVGDDYKVFIFTPDFPKPYYGMKFKWGNNYWFVINTDNLGGLSTSAEVRRCNNVLRFFDSEGNKIYEPCILDKTLRFTNNNDTSTIVTGKAEQYVWCQRNERTITIKPNDRFLFGVPEQRIGFRLYAGGFGNSINTITGDDTSPTLTQFYIEEYEINYELDDIVEGFANAHRYPVEELNSLTTMAVQESMTRGDNYDILIDPNYNSILKGQEQTFRVSLYKNNEIQADVLNIVDVTVGVPRKNYTLVTDNNSFTLNNKGMYMNEPVKIQCSCEYFTKTFEITLKGVY